MKLHFRKWMLCTWGQCCTQAIDEWNNVGVNHTKIKRTLQRLIVYFRLEERFILIFVYSPGVKQLLTVLHNIGIVWFNLVQNK